MTAPANTLAPTISPTPPRLAADCDVTGFLDDLHIRRSPAFAEWADGIRAKLVRRQCEVLAQATAEAMATRQWREAVRYAERWVKAAPLDSAPNAALIEAHFMDGDRALALDAFAQYRSRFAEETGQAPERALAELAERIRNAGVAAARRRATEEWYAAAPSFQGSLIGRGGEWDALTSAWRKAADGSAQIALIEGDAGVGKSRLVEDFARWVSASGGTVLRGRGYDARGGVPLGAIIEVVAHNVPVGLGAPLYAKLDQDIASAMMSINAVKGVEIGAGFAAASLTGEQNADEMRSGADGRPEFTSNNAGGILGGISTGQPIVARFAVKPTSSILNPRQTVNKAGEEVEISTKGRHDPCVGIRAVPIGEAMLACVLADHYLRHRGQVGG